VVVPALRAETQQKKKMKIKFSFACAAVVGAFALTLLYFWLQNSGFAAGVFVVVTVVLTAILTIINLFMLLYLFKLKTMNRYEIPHSSSVHDADNGTDCPPHSGCQSKSAA
jgi:amino acid transporter